MLTRDDILNYALALPPGDRELVAAVLQDSLEAEREQADTLVHNEFYQELQRRSAAYRAGQTRARLATEIMTESFQRQADEKSS